LIVKVGFPPQYDKMVVRFPGITPTAVFAYGDTLYNPSGGAISDDLMAHEETHAGRQVDVGGPAEWWRMYMADEDFLISEEAFAYGAQARFLAQRTKDRNARFRVLMHLAQIFSGPLYGNVVTFDQAVILIRKAAKL
jgi:hypothetical protein